jgi:hypothetical protein
MLLVFCVKKYAYEFLTAWLALLIFNTFLFHNTTFGYTYLAQIQAFFGMLLVASFVTGYILFLFFMIIALIFLSSVSEQQKKLTILLGSVLYLIVVALLGGMFNFSPGFEWPLTCFISTLGVNFFIAAALLFKGQQKRI